MPKASVRKRERAGRRRDSSPDRRGRSRGRPDADRHRDRRATQRSHSREREGQERAQPRSRSRSYERRYEDAARRVEALESLVERLMSRESQGTETTTTVRMAVKSDCIPQFKPGEPNQPMEKWLDKIEQLGRVNRWDQNTMIHLMQNRLTGLARKWYDNLTEYTHT